MSFNGEPTSNELAVMQRVQRCKAVANAHGKLTRADAKDAVLREADVDDTRRFVVSKVRSFNGEPREHKVITLMPPRGYESDKHDIDELVLEIPVQSLETASDHLRNMYFANIEAQQLSVAALSHLLSPEPIAIPGQTIFGEAFKRDGTSLRFMVGPETLQAFANDNDLDVIDPGENLGGQDYTVLHSYETGMLQSEMTAEWFDEERLADIIGSWDVVQFSGYHGKSSVA